MSPVLAKIPRPAWVLFLVAAIPGVLAYCTNGADAWLAPAVGAAMIPFVLSVTKAWSLVSNRCVQFLDDHTAAVVTVAAFAAGGSLVALTLIASVATPDQGPAAVGLQQFLGFIGTPIARATYTATTTLQAIALVLLVAALPEELNETRRVLATLAVGCCLVFLIEFGALIDSIPALSLEGFFRPSSECCPVVPCPPNLGAAQ